LTPHVRARRVGNCQKTHNRLKREDKGMIRVFSGQKTLNTDAAIFHHNSRYLPDVPVANVDKQMHVIMCTKTPEKNYSA